MGYGGRRTVYSAPGTLLLTISCLPSTSHLPKLKVRQTSQPTSEVRVRTTSILYMYPAPGRGNAVGEITGPAALPARQGAGTLLCQHGLTHERPRSPFDRRRKHAYLPLAAPPVGPSATNTRPPGLQPSRVPPEHCSSHHDLLTNDPAGPSAQTCRCTLAAPAVSSRPDPNPSAQP